VKGGNKLQITGGKILIKCLLEQGVDTVFGFPGGTVLNIYDELYHHKTKIKHILTSHEQGAAHAADGYARSTGKVGVCIATSGPGATNLVTGIATAYMDSVPLIAITGNVPVSLLGKDSFQEIDIMGVTMPITKHNFIVKDVKDLAATIRKAFYLAQEGRPGPVLIDIPKDITIKKADYKAQKPKKITKMTEYITDKDIEKTLQMIETSQKPLIYAGGGIIWGEAEKELAQFVQTIQSPVCCSLMGISGFPADDPLYIGMVGMHGTKTASLATTHCDLMIVLGARFSDRVVGKLEQFAPGAKILHVDIDAAEINKNVQTHHHIIGDVKEVLKKINHKLKKQTHKKWLEQIKGWKTKYPLVYKKDKKLKPQYIIEKVYELTKNKAIVTTEVGQHQMWAAQYYSWNKARTFISSGGLGTMGFGLGAAIGTQVGNPKKRVLNIAGDGSFRMNCHELATAVEYELPVIIVLINNSALGMVRQWQNLFYDSRFSHTHLDHKTDFCKLAEAYGAVGLKLDKTEDVEKVIKKALALKRPVVIDCKIEREENVYPMVPPGKALQDIIIANEECDTGFQPGD
jgi:acetolactate synthase I/II/III large subunit